MKNDMTQGSIAGALTAFTVPLILSGVFQQLFNWVDAFIVGNVEGELALGGIGAVTSTYSMFVMVIVGFTSGLSVLAAQRFGMGRTEDLGPLLTTFSLILGGIYLAVCAFGAVFVEDILICLNTPANIFQHAEDYLRIMFAGIPFLALYNTCCAVLRGLGDSKAPFASVMVCCVINVLLDLIFIAGLRMGTAGAAIATVLSQIAMTVYILWYAGEKYPFLRPRRGMFRRSTAGEGTRFGVPPAIQSGTTSFGNILLQRFMNGFGDQTVAAITTAYRVDTVLLLPIVNFGSGVATMVAQNIGAGHPERGEEGAENRGGHDCWGISAADPADPAGRRTPHRHVRADPGVGGNRQAVLHPPGYLLCGLRPGHGGAGLPGGSGGHDLLRSGGGSCPAGAHCRLLCPGGSVRPDGYRLRRGHLLAGAAGTVPAAVRLEEPRPARVNPSAAALLPPRRLRAGNPSKFSGKIIDNYGITRYHVSRYP